LAILVTAYAGMSASGYLLPVGALLVSAALVWLGQWRLVVVSLAAANLLSEVLMDTVLGIGDGLGRTKLDIAGVLLLTNFVCGGPLMTVIALPLLAAFRWSKELRRWFQSHETAAATELA